MRTHKATRIIVLALCCAALAICAGGCGRGEGFKKEYKLQVNVGATTYWGIGAARFAELAGKKTGGKIRVKPYYGSQLLKGAQLNAAQMVSTGAIDCAFESTINIAPVIAEMNAFSLPFFINTYENLDRLEYGRTGELLFDAMRAKGLEPLAWGENGFRQLTNGTRRVHAPGDLRGLRVRVVGSPIFVDIFRRLGADPINMNWGDAVTAFQQGTVDGQENPAAILISVQIHQYHRYATFWNYLADPLVFLWNKKQWEKFPEDIREAITESAQEAGEFEKALCRCGLDDGTAARMLRDTFGYDIPIGNPRAFLASKGMAVDTLTEPERQAFRDALAPVSEAWREKVGERVMAAAWQDLAGK